VDALFLDDTDRADCLARLAEQGALTVYSRALLPNHAYLLVRTGKRSLLPLSVHLRKDCLLPRK
jgi:hypothetical protein